MPVDYLLRETRKLYDKQIDCNDLNAIDKHCEFIATFIKSCGYTEEEFVRLDNNFETDMFLN